MNSYTNTLRALHILRLVVMVGTAGLILGILCACGGGGSDVDTQGQNAQDRAAAAAADDAVAKKTTSAPHMTTMPVTALACQIDRTCL